MTPLRAADADAASTDAEPAATRIRRRTETPATREVLVRALTRAGGTSALRAALARSPHLQDADMVRRLNAEAMRVAGVDLVKADQFVRTARWLADRLADPSARASTSRTAGHVLALTGRYPQALVLYRAALELLSSPSDDAERALTLSGALQTLIYLGDYETAHAFADQARAIFTERGDRVRLARLDTNVGNVLYRQDRFRDALACYRRAHRALLEVGTPLDVATVLRNIAVCRISLNDFTGALETHLDARSWCDRHHLPRLAAEADYNIAYLHYLRGDYARAIELYRATRVYCQRVGDRYHQALCDLDQSEMNLELNLNDEGEHLASRACRAFRRLHMRYELGKGLVNLGVAAVRAGESTRALDVFEQARAVFAQEHNRHWLTITDLYRALVLADRGDTSRARRLCRTALAYFLDEGPPGKAALCELLLGKLDLRSGRPSEARAMVEGAIARAEAAEATPLAAQGYVLLGEIHEALGDSEAAYAAYRQAHAGLEALRSHIVGEQVKIAFLKDKLSVFESLVALALEREPSILRARVAFRYIEQAKSRSLADIMAFGPPPPRADEHDTAAAQNVLDLRKELTWWYRKVEAHESTARPGPRPSTVHAARLRARDCESRLARAQAELDHADAEVRVLGSGTALPLEAIRTAIPADTALVEYYEARGMILGCVLTADRLEIVPVAPVSHVRTLQRLLQFQLSKFALDERYAERFAPELLAATTDHLYDLYDALLEPLAPHLRERHLVVVPHGFLHYLPFHALFDGTRFLCDRVSVSYAPSATTYYLCRSRLAQSEARSLVLGVPDPRAPHILDEVDAVSAALPSPAVFIGAEATDARLRDLGPGARYVHVATHGLFRQDNPMFSAVRLGNGELSLLDLYRLRFSADLITLSGCGTGLSSVVGGDELVGLVRGLLYAGARALLVTLWDVHDRSTATFMRTFYQRLRSDLDPRRAMTAAMQEVRAEYPHPYFWAPFVLIGDSGRADRPERP